MRLGPLDGKKSSLFHAVDTVAYTEIGAVLSIGIRDRIWKTLRNALTV
jgi:hypothetical protein